MPEHVTTAAPGQQAADHQAISVFRAELGHCIVRLDDALRVLEVQGPSAVGAARGTAWHGESSAAFVLAADGGELVRGALVETVRGALTAYTHVLQLAAVTP